MLEEYFSPVLWEEQPDLLRIDRPDNASVVKRVQGPVIFRSEFILGHRERFVNEGMAQGASYRLPHIFEF